METVTPLRRWRCDAGITMEKLSVKAETNYGLLSQYERGIKLPSMQTAERLAKALGVEVSDLYPSEDLKNLGGHA